MVSPPTRPKYIKRIRITFENMLRSSVIPRESPTVAMAEAASKEDSISVTPSAQVMRKLAAKNRPRYNTRMAMAFLRIS